MFFKNLFFFFLLFAFPHLTYAEENKLKAALVLRTHTYKIMECDQQLDQARLHLDMAHDAIGKNQWALVENYLSRAEEDLKKLESFFPSTAAGEKLRAAQAFYAEKKFAQASAVLELSSEELRWLGYYKETPNLSKEMKQVEQWLVQQKSTQFEKGMEQALKEIFYPSVDENLNQAQAEIFLSLAAWKKKNPEEVSARVKKAQEKLSQLTPLLDLAQARHYLARTRALAQNQGKEKTEARMLKQAAQRFAKLQSEAPAQNAYRDCLAQIKRVRQGWGKKEVDVKEELKSLLQKVDALLASGNLAD